MCGLDVDYAFLRGLVYEHTRNVLDPSRDYLFNSRLHSLLRGRGFQGLEELVAVLKEGTYPSLERSVAENMTINETSFFRDTRPFELLRMQLLPQILERRAQTRTLRLWSAASSSGQEAYSLAMLLREHFPLLNGWDISILGTDISREMVRRSTEGIYKKIEVNRGLPVRFLLRYFEPRGEDWQVKQELRSMCSFRVLNLCAMPLLPVFDVILLRNVMFYFDNESRKRVLANIHRTLSPNGVLFLGSAEQPAEPSLWNTVLSGGTSYYTPRPHTTS